MIQLIKYSNRKLYNKDKGGYITLDDVKDYIVKKQDFKVVDYSSKNDITELTVLKTMYKVLESKKGNINKYKEIISFI